MAGNQLFFEGSTDPFSDDLTFGRLMESLAEQQAASDPFSAQQAQQAIAPNAQSPAMGMAGPPTLPMGGGTPPYVPPAPVQQPRVGGMLPGQQGLQDFLGSPGAAMASAAFRNLGNSGAGHPSGGRQVDPIQAYQQAVNTRAVMAQRDQAAKLREAAEERLKGQEGRAAEKFEIDKDPAYAYTQLRDRGLIPEDMSFVDYNTKFGQGAAPKSIQEWNTYNAMTPEDQKAYLTMKRASQIIGGGGGTSRILSPDGSSAVVGDSAPTIAKLDANLASTVEGAKTTAGESAKTNQDQVSQGIEQSWGLATGYADAQEVLDSSKEYLSMLESGQVDTGFIPNMLLNTFGIGTEELGTLNNEAIMQGLRNLGITNLAPVTEQEFAQVLRLWADIGLSEEPNIGSVKTAIKRTERLQRRMKTDAVKQAGRVRQYGSPEQYQDLINSNPFISGVMNPQAGSGDSGDDKVINLVMKDGKLVQE